MCHCGCLCRSCCGQVFELCSRNLSVIPYPDTAYINSSVFKAVLNGRKFAGIRHPSCGETQSRREINVGF